MVIAKKKIYSEKKSTMQKKILIDAVQYALPILGLLWLLYRTHFAFSRAEQKKQLKSGTAGASITFSTEDITEPWEKKAISRAKTGGGYVRIPYNNQGVFKKICYVGPQPSEKTVSMQCEN